MSQHVIALDQGTTSSRAIIFDVNGKVVSLSQHPFAQIYPQPGWVEHDPMTILYTQLESLSEAFRTSGLSAADIAAVGITNQRETTIVWEKETGRPVYNAIVWQCRRTAPLCEELRANGWEEKIREKTGLLIDAYFSGTKLRWILDNVPGARERAERGELLFGTVDTWLIWNLTGGRVHVTDYSNASRTMLFNIHTLQWDAELCEALRIPMCMLPKPVSNSEEYGTIDSHMPGLEELSGTPICGAAGDQQAALLGQGCIHPGEAKNTYGTGCFAMMNTGPTVPVSRSGLLSCVAWSIRGETNYCLEGSVFNAGSTVQWMRDELHLISSAEETQALAESVPDNGGVYLVSAFRTGICTRAARSSASPAGRRARTLSARDLKASPIRCAISSTRWKRTPARPCRSCAWTAALLSTAFSCSFRRTSSAVPSTGPLWWRQRRSARRSSPGCTPECGRMSAISSASANRRTFSARKWTRKARRSSAAAGIRPWSVPKIGNNLFFRWRYSIIPFQAI